jgi:hypothetical protein
LKKVKKDASNIDYKKNRMGVISLDFDTMIIFGGERNNKEYSESYIYEFYDNKFYQFNDLVRISNFIVSPIYYNGRYFMFDFLNNVLEFSLETLNFKYHEFHESRGIMNQ